MVDVHSKKQRSYNMSRIRAQDTKPEVILRKALWAKGLRYRIKTRLLGKPDIVFVRQRVVIFVDGCFWHRCPDHFQAPRTRAEFWEEKISKNVARDIEVTGRLTKEGWDVLRFWEHELSFELENVLDRCLAKLNKKKCRTEEIS